MQLFDLYERKIDAIRQIGLRAVAEARRDGVPVYYIDAELGPGIVREMPDGSRERVERRDGALIVIEQYGPRR